MVLCSQTLRGVDLKERRTVELKSYLQLLEAGASHNAERVESLSDLSFKDLKLVIQSYLKTGKTNADHGFQQLLLRNSRQYLLPVKMLKFYAPGYFQWLEEKSPVKDDFFKILSQSQMNQIAADLAVRLTPEESLKYITQTVESNFKKELLFAWSRRLNLHVESRPLNKELVNEVIHLKETSKEYLLFKGYWYHVKMDFYIDLARLLRSEKREEVIRALEVQETHPVAFEQNKYVIQKWKDDEAIVIQALKNYGETSAKDFSSTLRSIWENYPLSNKQRFWCLYSMSVHNKGNEKIAVEAVLKDGYHVLEPALSILRNSPDELKKVIEIMLTKYGKGHSEVFIAAAKAQLKGFEENALEVLESNKELITQINALSYLSHSNGDYRLKLLKFLSHPSEDVRLAAINTFTDGDSLKQDQKNKIGPYLIKVFQSDPSYGNRQQALYVLGRWKAVETKKVFSQLLQTINAADYGGDEYWEYRMKLMCFMGMARMGDEKAYDQLTSIHKRGSALERMDILLAYMDLGKCPEFAFEDLENTQPKLAATAAVLIRECGSTEQKNRLKDLQSGYFWQEFPHTKLDEYNIIEHDETTHEH